MGKLRLPEGRRLVYHWQGAGLQTLLLISIYASWGEAGKDVDEKSKRKPEFPYQGLNRFIWNCLLKTTTTTTTTLCFLEKFWVHSKIEQEVHRVLRSPCPSTTSPTINIPHQSSTLVIIDGPILARHHPKPTVYIRVHSCCCTFYGFWQLYNDMYPLL